MGWLSYFLGFFNLNSHKSVIEGTLDQPCDDNFSSAPSAKRFKPNSQYPGLNHSILIPSMSIGNMSPKQYFQSKRKIPAQRRPPTVFQIIETDDEDCQIIENDSVPGRSGKKSVSSSCVSNDDDDEIQVLSSTQGSGNVKIPSQEAVATPSPCSSRSHQKTMSKNKAEPEIYPIDEDEDDRGSNNKENNGNAHGNQKKCNDDGGDIEALERCPKAVAKKMQMSNMYPRWSSVDCGMGRSLLSRNTGSSFLFKKKQPHERQNLVHQMKKLQSRESYAKLLQAVASLSSTGGGTGDSGTILPSSSRNSSTPSCSELDILERLTSQAPLSSTSRMSRHVSVNVGNKTRSYIDIEKPGVSSGKSNGSDTSGSGRFRFLDAAPQSLRSRIPMKTASLASGSSELDAMVRRVQAINLHRFDSNISRQALALERTNEKVRSLEIPSYDVLVEKTINLRKVPERLQIKKIEPQLPEITEEMEILVKRMKASGRMDTVVSKVGLEEITKDQILSLEGLTWLKDNVINCYMALLMERSKAKEGELPRVHGFNTFFHSALHEHGYARVKRWTKKVDLFSYDLLLVPIHVQKIHWCLAVIDFRNKSLTYYDSMAGPDRGCLQRLLKYLGDESMDKKKIPFEMSTWSMQCPKDVPQQQNSSDCGVFTSTFAEYLARNADIARVKQDDMRYYRKKMMVEILMKKLLT